ncbi:MAG TPA: serine hydrolase domain-containing protein [Gemmataceae bacterium]|nr:serine hydrolase domain-containing protein [Gemmataceae bacterium]
MQLKRGDRTPVSFAHLIAFTMGVPLDPGTDSKYSNFDYMVLGEVIAKASGQRYEKYVRERVLAPMSVRNASLHPLGGRYFRVLSEPKRCGYYKGGSWFDMRYFMKRNPNGVNWVLLFNASMQPDALDSRSSPTGSRRSARRWSGCRSTRTSICSRSFTDPPLQPATHASQMSAASEAWRVRLWAGAEERVAFAESVRRMEREVRQEQGHPPDEPLGPAAQVVVGRVAIGRALVAQGLLRFTSRRAPGQT